jgi:Zn finger protein HypA/HybF involved in hydrogenase expression
MIDEATKRYVLQMPTNRDYCRCPNCKQIVQPRGWRLLWCPLCYKGNAGMLWISYGTIEELAQERLDQLK